MALLERVMSLKQQGMQESQIINTLKEEGISPVQINEALSQSKIKAAVDVNNSTNSEEMQPSIMPSLSQQSMQQEAPSPNAPSNQTGDYSYSPQMQQPAQQTQQNQQYVYSPSAYEQTNPYADPQAQQSQQYAYDPNQQQYAQGDYYNQDQYSSQIIDIETIRSVSQQEIEVSLKKIKESIDDLTKTKTNVNFEVQRIENRLQKIETIIEQLQSAIIRKMGEYGESVSNISKELRATQDSFSKILNPLLDKKRGISQEMENEGQDSEESEKEINQQKPSPKKSRQEAKDSASFEDYLR